MPTLNINNLFDIQYALKTLHDANLLTNEYQQLIETSSAPCDLANILIELDGASLVNPGNIAALSGISDLYYFSEILFTLNQGNILTEDFLQKLFHIDDLMHLSHILGILSMFEMLTPDNLDKIINHHQLNLISYAMAELNKVQLLNQPNFEALLDPEHSALLTTQAMHLIFDHLPPHLLAANWRHILEIIRLDNPFHRLEQFINLILGFFHQEDEEEDLNSAQSTHTASVHQTVSESAIKLMARYHQNNSENLMKNLIYYLKNNHPTDIKYECALRCLTKLTAPNYDFIDPVSQISIQKLLLLCLHAISDEKLRMGSYQDALEQLIEGFYEIQRGYNLNEKGIDRGGEDMPICKAGSFNKLIEKLQGIHPDCHLQYITNEVASLKLPIVVREEVFQYLAFFSSPKKILELISFTNLIHDITNDGIEIIWPSIKQNVSLRIYQEFSSLFSKYFPLEQFIESGQYTQIAQLDKFQEPITNSKGYKKFCHAAMHQLGLFTRYEKTFNQNLDIQVNKISHIQN